MKELHEGESGLISIVIPVYNAEKYICECLDSVTGQTYPNLEIICVNDGSTDNSLNILESYAAKDSRIRIFSKKNEGKGAASARNLGLENATGEYIIFLDADDFFEKDMLKVLINKAEETNAEVVICDAQIYDNQLKRVIGGYRSIELPLAPKKDFFSYKDCPDYIFQIADIIAWNKFFRMDFIRTNHLKFEPIPISDDQYLPSLAVVLAKRISIVEQKLIYYRISTGDSQMDSKAKHPEAAYQASYSIVKEFKKMGIYQEIKRSYVNVIVRLMRLYFDHMRSMKNLSFLYEKIKAEALPLLEAEVLPEGYFYDERIYSWYKMVTTTSLEEILFQTATAYGSQMTTGILRFQLPYDQIEKASRIVLVGKGLVGRYWYAQLLLSEYAQVVAWISDEKELPENLSYDSIVYAK